MNMNRVIVVLGRKASYYETLYAGQDMGRATASYEGAEGFDEVCLFRHLVPRKRRAGRRALAAIKRRLPAAADQNPAAADEGKPATGKPGFAAKAGAMLARVQGK